MVPRLSVLFCAFLLVGASPGTVPETVVAPQLDGATLRARLAGTMAPEGRAMPADVRDLDAMMASGDVARLTARLRSAHVAHDIDLDMNWEQSRIYDGAGFIVAYAYMNDLWRFGSAMPPPAGEEIKQSAAMMFLYIYDLATIDGPRCADVSAPGHRVDQLISQNRPLIAYLGSLPRADRMQLGTVSLDIEAATFPFRKDDAVLCSGGLAQITGGLQAQGDKPLPQVPNAPGTIGKTYAVPSAPDYKPGYVSAEAWRPKAAAARAMLPASLTRLLAQLDTSPPAAAGK